MAQASTCSIAEPIGSLPSARESLGVSNGVAARPRELNFTVAGVSARVCLHSRTHELAFLPQ